MEMLHFGDVILLKFPFTDGVSFKRRPALVVNDFDDDDILVCRITSRLYDTEFDVKIDDWNESGLKLPSVIRVHKLATLQKELIEMRMGTVDQPTREKVKVLIGKLVK